MPWNFPPSSVHPTQQLARESRQLEPEVSETGSRQAPVVNHVRLLVNLPQLTIESYFTLGR